MSKPTESARRVEAIGTFQCAGPLTHPFNSAAAPPKLTLVQGLNAMSSLAGRTILVVEDEVLIALDLVKSIEEAGARTIVAHTAKAGIAFVQCEDISAAIVDHQLGDEDSANLCECLTAASIPFVIYSGYPDRPAAWSNAPFLHKPTPGKEMVVTIAGVLR
jgi:DNA-binding NtrC family response regulator